MRTQSLYALVAQAARRRLFFLGGSQQRLYTTGLEPFRTQSLLCPTLVPMLYFISKVNPLIYFRLSYHWLRTPANMALLRHFKLWGGRSGHLNLFLSLHESIALILKRAFHFRETVFRVLGLSNEAAMGPGTHRTLWSFKECIHGDLGDINIEMSTRPTGPLYTILFQYGN